MENTQHNEENTSRRADGAALASQQGGAAACQMGATPKSEWYVRGLSRETASLLPLAITLLAVALLVLGWRAWRNHCEIELLRRNGYRRMCARVYRRGSVSPEFMHVIAELITLLLLLGSVLGWLGLGRGS